MTDLVKAADVEEILGLPRDVVRHYARAVSAEGRVFLMHSNQCLLKFEDLRACPFSRALDLGIDLAKWVEDVSTIVEIDGERLVPIGGQP